MYDKRRLGSAAKFAKYVQHHRLDVPVFCVAVGWGLAAGGGGSWGTGCFHEEDEEDHIAPSLPCLMDIRRGSRSVINLLYCIARLGKSYCACMFWGSIAETKRVPLAAG